MNGSRMPLANDPSGTFWRPEGRYFLSGTVPAEGPEVDWDDFEPHHEEFERIWMDLAELHEAFDAIKSDNFRVGHDAFNGLVHHMIAGPHSEVHSSFFANGFSGDGLQQSPAVGRCVSEWIVYGAFRTLDLSALGHDRVARNEPLLEKCCNLTFG